MGGEGACPYHQFCRLFRRLDLGILNARQSFIGGRVIYYYRLRCPQLWCAHIQARNWLIFLQGLICDGDRDAKRNNRQRQIEREIR